LNIKILFRGYKVVLKTIDRRDFIKKAGAAGFAFISIPFVPDYLKSEVLNSPSILSIAMGKVKEGLLVEKALNALGGMKSFVKRGDIVVIKPNLVYRMNYKFGATTNPFVLKKVIELCFNAGAAKVKVAENPSDSNDAKYAFKDTGAFKVCKATGAELVYPLQNRFREMNIRGVALKKYPVFIDTVECDKLINLPIVKDHMYSNLSCAMKNFFGAVGGSRFSLHLELHQNIVDLAKFFKPALNIIDAYRVLKRNGPRGGSFRDVEKKYSIAAGTDIVACDAFAAGLLGMKVSDVEHIKLATSQKLGNSSERKIKKTTTCVTS
jgi:uncharacterized protein (DUF362 family)